MRRIDFLSLPVVVVAVGLAGAGGFGVGFGLGEWASARVIVIHDRELSAQPFAPEMSLDRFFTCSTTDDELSEAQWDALNTRWALRYWRPRDFDWPAP